jgi:hypothetical protein
MIPDKEEVRGEAHPAHAGPDALGALIKRADSAAQPVLHGAVLPAVYCPAPGRR